MANFNPGRFKPRGKQKVGQRGRQKVAPIGGQKKALPPVKNAQALVQRKSELEKLMAEVREQIRQSGKPCLDREILAKYRKIGRIAESIREIDDEIRGGKTQKPRYGIKPRKKG